MPSQKPSKKPSAKPSKPVEAELMDASEIIAVMPFSRASLYNWSNSGDFPQPIRIGRQRLRWRRADVSKWLTDRGLDPLPAPESV